MAQSLIIKDGYGAVKSLTVESGSYGFMPVHYVTSSTSAPVYITASSANPIPVTGNINVDVMVGDLITVTSSQANPVWVTGSTTVDVVIGDIINVTASAAAPVSVTGTITSNIALQTGYSPSTYTSNILPIQLVGSSSYKAAVDSSGRLFVTGSVTVNTGSSSVVTSSAAAPVYVTGAVTVNTGSLITATASLAAPVGVTGTVNVNNTVLTVTSSLLAPVVAYAYSPPVTTVAASSVTSFTWATAASGTFALASNSITRRGLTVFNPGPYNLYIAFSTAGGTTNGFTLINTSSAPTQYSFIVYPSGTYTADGTTVGVYHGGYFISGSASAGVFISAIS